MPLKRPAPLVFSKIISNADEFIKYLILFCSKYKIDLIEEKKLLTQYDQGNFYYILQIINNDSKFKNIIVDFFKELNINYSQSIICMKQYVRPSIQSIDPKSTVSLNARNKIVTNMKQFVESRKQVGSDDIHNICNAYGSLVTTDDLINVKPGQIFVQARSTYSNYNQMKHGAIFQIDEVIQNVVKFTYYELSGRDIDSDEFDKERRSHYSEFGNRLKRRDHLDCYFPYVTYPANMSRENFVSKSSHLIKNKSLYKLNAKEVNSSEIKFYLEETSKQTKFKYHGISYNCNHALYSILMYLIKNNKLLFQSNSGLIFRNYFLKNERFKSKYIKNGGGCTVVSGACIAKFGFDKDLNDYFMKYLSIEGLLSKFISLFGAGTFDTIKKSLLHLNIKPLKKVVYGNETEETGKLLNSDLMLNVLKPLCTKNNSIQAVLLKLEGHASSIVIKNNRIYVADILIQNGEVLEGFPNDSDNLIKIISSISINSNTLYKVWYF